MAEVPLGVLVAAAIAAREDATLAAFGPGIVCQPADGGSAMILTRFP